MGITVKMVLVLVPGFTDLQDCFKNLRNLFQRQRENTCVPPHPECSRNGPPSRSTINIFIPFDFNCLVTVVTGVVLSSVFSFKIVGISSSCGLNSH